jgi:PAS domain S-box-containing protein
VDDARATATEAVWHLNLRFVVLAVALNLVVGSAVVAYSIYDDHENTSIFLTTQAQAIGATVRRLGRSQPHQRPREKLAHACEITDVALAFVGRDGKSVASCPAALARYVERQRWPAAETPPGQVRLVIDEQLGEASGLWWLGPYDEDYRLLVVAPRSPEDEGELRYMTVAAALAGVGVLLNLVIMLAAANRMLRLPLEGLIGTLTGALVTDVQRRRRAERDAIQARKEAEDHVAFLDDLLNASEQVGIIAADREGIINTYNNAAEYITGIRSHEVVGQLTLGQLMVSLDPYSHDDRDGLASFGSVQADDRAIIDAKGLTHIVQTDLSRIQDRNGVAAGVLMLIRDVTTARRIEAELRLKEMQLIQSSRMATLGEMAAGVAHELNQPLNNVGLLAARANRRLQTKERLGEDDHRFLQEKMSSIGDQVARAAKIIEQLRFFGHTQERVLEAIAVSTAIKGTLDLLGEQLRLHGIVVDVDLPPDLPLVTGHVARLEQVLINVLINARFALDEYWSQTAREGTKRIQLRARPEEIADGKPAVVVEVEDNGPGMSAEVADRIFEPFFTTKNVGQGTGLGLSISYGIVREFGGNLTVRTRPDEGTTFVLLLPCAPKEATP